MTRGSDTLHFYYDAQGKPAIVIFNGTAYGYLYNLQGDVIALVNATGTKVVEYTYDAWGKVLTKTGSLASSLGTVQPFRYRGYVFDEETGLYYLRSRYYRPEWCRFLSTDALIKGNLYCYCENNSIILKDPSGNVPEDYIDITERLNAEMEEAYNEITHICRISSIVAAVVFANNVRSKGKWDLKTRKDWDLIPGGKYKYNGIVLEWDEPGNIMFGYVGSATQLKTAKEKALASTKSPLFPTNRHHIVAQFDIRAKPSWPILKKANINRFYDEENIVQVSTKMHWYMHTNLYHDSVYGVLYIAYQWPLGEYSCNVRFALGTIKVLIEAIDQAE